nr:hypothetical protein Iba_chr06cCG17160 [Ipomoea batatas]
MEEQGKRIRAATVEGEEEEEAGEADGEKTAMKWTAVGDARMEWRGDMREESALWAFLTLKNHW